MWVTSWASQSRVSKVLDVRPSFGSIDNLGLSIQSICGRNIRHTLLGETGADNVAGQILKALVVAGPDGRTAVDVEAAVAPGKHIFNDRIADFVFGLEHLEHLMTKQILKIFGLKPRAFGEWAGVGKTAIGGDQVKMGIKLLKITKGVHGDGCTGDGFTALSDDHRFPLLGL